MTGAAVNLQPLIGWPDQVSRGGEYLVTVDVRLLQEPTDWPYESEELPLTCVLDGGLAFSVESVDDITVVVHRFGGTYGPARFVITAAPSAEEGRHPLTLTIMTQRGAVIRSEELAVTIVDRQPETPTEQRVVVDRTPPRSIVPAATVDSRETRRPFFFLSYARSRYRPEGSDPDRWVTKFFDDLCLDVAQATGTPIPGYMDRQISAETTWSNHLSDALSSCRVFVALLSPAYFASENCGREWAAFVERVERQSSGESMPLAIVPVMWVPMGTGEMPSSLHSLQMIPPGFPPAYVTEGVYGIMKLGRYREHYKETIFRLAQVIKERATETALALGRVPEPDSLRSPFTEDRASVPVTPAHKPDRVSLSFSEEMKGFFAEDVDTPGEGEGAGREKGWHLSFSLNIDVDDVDAFLAEPDHTARATGWIDADRYGGRRPIQQGWFNLLSPGDAPGNRIMRYRLHFTDAMDRPHTLSGWKDIRHLAPSRIWRDTTTLYFRILDGHARDGDDDEAPVMAAGILRLSLEDFARQLTTFHTEGRHGVAALDRFGQFFLGELWQIYRPVSG